ncbi:hypothetical protein Sme01_12830 [Sphaerisporangium melleum]|uniref:Serine/threonine protein kinase n=1 Tax=Sphaerisporangium melleum TaxID=321316 RepID=A0A917VS11_9ACTN|nr:hypothetical protein GCM10007964_58600 [Sphaerisporangium melleum]GII68807.1 hypothetical protein Sme01_12830 [Sphaerisporangium melleum]
MYTLGAGVVLALGLGVASAQTAPRTDAVSAAGKAPAASSTAKSTPSATPDPAVQVQADGSASPAPTIEAEEADPAPKRADYAGVAQGNGGLVALSIRNGKAVAYFCDGRVESWLKGTADGSTLTLTGKDALITVALGDGKAQGRLQVGKGKWRFTAPLVHKPSGLYRASAVVRGARVVGGWIVLPNGRQVGLLDVGGSSAPAPRLTPGSPMTFEGTELRPQEPDAFLPGL